VRTFRQKLEETLQTAAALYVELFRSAATLLTRRRASE